MTLSTTRPLFIAIEGIAGGGKSTLADSLEREIRSRWDIDTAVTKAYEGAWKEAANSFASIIGIDPTSIPMMFLFQVLHAKQFSETVSHLKAGKLVIADRWRHSFWAYHSNFGPLRTESNDVLQTLDRLAYSDVDPDITLFLDLPVELAISRFEKRERKTILSIPDDRIAFWNAFREYYLSVCKKENWIRLDASQPPEQVLKQSILAIDAYRCANR